LIEVVGLDWNNTLTTTEPVRVKLAIDSYNDLSKVTLKYKYGATWYEAALDSFTSYSSGTNSFTFALRDMANRSYVDLWISAKDIKGNVIEQNITKAFYVKQAPTTATLDLVVRGTDNAVYSRLFSGTSWGAWKFIPGAIFTGPGATISCNKLHVAVVGTGGSLYYGYVDLSTGTFSGWTMLPGNSPSPPALASSEGKLYLVVRGSDNGIYLNVRSSTGSWGGWSRLLGTIYEGPSAAIVGDILHIVVQGTSKAIFHGRMNLTNGQFLGWTMLPGATPSSPALAASSDGKLYLVVRGMDNFLYWNCYTGNSWVGWRIIPGGYTNSGPGATVDAGKLYVVARSSSNDIYICGMDLATSQWSGWTKLVGSTPSEPELCSP
jgi:hypothetical protein